jgi:hypothetical protein
MGRIVLYKNAADPLEAYGSAAERRKRAIPPFAAIEAARAPAGTSESGNPHIAYNKTIPYRFVLVNDSAMA